MLYSLQGTGEMISADNTGEQPITFPILKISQYGGEKFSKRNVFQIFFNYHKFEMLMDIVNSFYLTPFT